MADVIPAATGNKPHLFLTAEEVRDLPWIPFEDDNTMGIPLRDMSDEQVQMAQEALMLHGIYTSTFKKNDEHYLSMNMATQSNINAINVLKNAPNDFIGGVFGYGIGPDPRMNDLDVAHIANIEEKLQEARFTNAVNGRIVAGISPDEADDLLNWMVQRTRNHLFTRSYGNHSMQTPLSVQGACGLAQGITAHQADTFRLDNYCHQVSDVSDDSHMRHAFNVIDIPVEENGKAQIKPYLVDVSFRQFFDHEFCYISNPKSKNKVTQGPSWGANLVKTPEGKDLADSILRNGYAPLTKETARLYVESQTFKRSDDQTTLTPTEWRTNTHVLDLREDTSENDYLLSEMVEWGVDIRTPKMVLNDEPLENVLDDHDNSALSNNYSHEP